jgi:hypothetical protein
MMGPFWQQLKAVAVGLFALLLGGSALWAAVKGLLRGAVHCLLCRRNSPDLSFSQAPGLYVVSVAMLLALGALGLLAAVVCWRELMQGDRPAPKQPPPRDVTRQATNAQAAPRTAAHQSAQQPANKGDAWARPSPHRRASPSAAQPPGRSGTAVHGLGGALLLGAALLGLLARSSPHSSTDLSFAALLLPLAAFGLAFLGALVLMKSPRPAVAGFARAVVALVVLAGLLLKLWDGRGG